MRLCRWEVGSLLPHGNRAKGLRSKVGWCVMGVGPLVWSQKSREESGRTFYVFGLRRAWAGLSTWYAGSSCPAKPYKKPVLFLLQTPDFQLQTTSPAPMTPISSCTSPLSADLPAEETPRGCACVPTGFSSAMGTKPRLAPGRGGECASGHVLRCYNNQAVPAPFIRSASLPPKA